MTELLVNIPQEMRDLEQWVIAGPDKSPWSTGGYRASVTDPEGWTDFYSAGMVAGDWGASHIGFIICAQDPFVCIDLDVKDAETHPDKPEVWTTEQELARYHKIIQSFNSYTEYSRSGKGFHIWVRGAIGLGCKHEGVEVYSQERFIICTGNVYLDAPIADRQDMVELLVGEIRQKQGSHIETELVEVAEELTDEQLWNRASTAVNADKFIALWSGVWQGEYPSQSEADLSLMSMLTFYSKSNEQCRRMFRLCALGQRTKATKNDYYLNNTLKLIRGRMEQEQLVAGAVRNSFEQTVEKVKVQKALPPVARDPLPYPPGAVGWIAQWLYSHAPRPVQEIAIASALAVFAGLCGRGYSINRSGLNLYMVLVAKSAVGKEAIHSGLSKLVAEVAGGAPSFNQYIDFAEYASGPALIKSFGERKSFVNIAGEWGRKMRKMADDHADGPVSGLRTVMTNLYQKSSAGTMVGGIGYSDKEKDVKSIDGVAYSMLGETTPANFYESLTNTMMEDGFMSRFVVIEYEGLRPELVTTPGPPLPHGFREGFQTIAKQVECLADGQSVVVHQEPEAAAMLEAFNQECDAQINSTEDEGWRQMWNRAHLKALKISALLSIPENPGNPIVNSEHAAWALDLVKRDIRIMSKKMEGGDIGTDDGAREKKILTMLADYLQNPVAPSYGVSELMRTNGYVPRKYLQIRSQKVNSFMKYRNGATKALDECLRSLCDSGYIVEVPAGKVPQEYGFHGKCYRIVTLPDAK